MFDVSRFPMKVTYMVIFE